MRISGTIFIAFAFLVLWLPLNARADDDDDERHTFSRESSLAHCQSFPELPRPEKEEPGCAVIPRDSQAQLSGIAAYEYDLNSRNGPPNWGSMDCTSKPYAHFRDCAYCSNTCNGHRQSPINVVKEDAKSRSVSKSPRILLRKIVPVRYHIQSKSFNLACQLPGQCGSVNFKHTQYQMSGVHLHRDSEHQIDGKHFPLELHIVHTSKDKFLVLALFFRPGRFNPELQKLLDISKHRCSGPLNLQSLAKKSFKAKNLIRYRGSLTTPPCTEKVTWIISTVPQEASLRQISMYRKMTAGEKGNRPIQPLNGRSLFTYD